MKWDDRVFSQEEEWRFCEKVNVNHEGGKR